MTSSPFENLLERNEREKVELEKAKANRALRNNKNGDKTEKGETLKEKKKLILNSIENPQQVRQIMRGQYAQAANKHMMKIGSSVDYVRGGGMSNVPVTQWSICMRLLLNFRCVLLASRPVYSEPARRARVRSWIFFLLCFVIYF
ncbi:hypothetical protein AVEN_40738-1 [Araneus ventricosus]|uniref:Uncharacterized protein n=1 Tax=Araneus ventricosus TaxID=182803 RepID=A0A4Y2EKZ2_ARAVE|nr:hypothetical protein AVEN_40738-1 [Araneus ventricosus]